MRRLLRWAIYIGIALVFAGVAGFFALKPVTKSLAEKRIEAETGMDAQIGEIHLDLGSRSLHIRGFKLINPPEFGGSTFIDIPELRVELDTDAWQDKQIHFKVIHLDLAELHLVQSKDGKKNIDLLQKRKGQGAVQSKSTSTTHSRQAEPIVFGGIDYLKVSIGKLKWTDELSGNGTEERLINMRDRVYTDIKDEKDLQAVQVAIGLQAGVSMWANDAQGLPKDMFHRRSGGSAQMAEMLKVFLAPLTENK